MYFIIRFRQQTSFGRQYNRETGSRGRRRRGELGRRRRRGKIGRRGRRRRRREQGMKKKEEL